MQNLIKMYNITNILSETTFWVLAFDWISRNTIILFVKLTLLYKNGAAPYEFGGGSIGYLVKRGITAPDSELPWYGTSW